MGLRRRRLQHRRRRCRRQCREGHEVLPLTPVVRHRRRRRRGRRGRRSQRGRPTRRFVPRVNSFPKHSLICLDLRGLALVGVCVSYLGM